MEDLLYIAGKKIHSRLLVGTGKFSSTDIMRDAIESSESHIITTALRRVNFNETKDPFLSTISREKYIFLANTSGARNAEEALRIAKIIKGSGLTTWIKVEITPEPNYLMPDPIETLKTCESLVKEGFTVLPYINADPILGKRLEECGCAAVMPLGSPIGSNQGIKTKELIQIMIEQIQVPIIVDAGIGKPSHAAQAMELGADAVLINTAIATASDPKNYAIAFKEAIKAGRRAFLSGIPGEQEIATASSPLTGFLYQ